MFAFHCGVEVVGETIVVFLSERSSKSEECSYSVATEESKLDVIRRGLTGLLWKRILIPHLFHYLHTLRLNHL